MNLRDNVGNVFILMELRKTKSEAVATCLNK